MEEMKKGPIKGWKCFNQDLKCIDMQFEIGKKYEHAGDIEMCKSGFHFHENANDIFYYYDEHDSIVCEIEAHDVLSGYDKSVCKKIEIKKQISILEVYSIKYGYGHGYGYGYGDGDGNGDGDGYRYSDGDGNGNGDGDGDGYGYGDGNGYGYGNAYGYSHGSVDRDGYGNHQFIFGLIKERLGA